jgi:hypothetical protein
MKQPLESDAWAEGSLALGKLKRLTEAEAERLAVFA